MEPKLFEKYVKLCRKYGIHELKVGETEIKLSQTPPKSPYKAKKESALATMQDSIQPPLSDMDVLLWSTGGVPMNEVSDA